MKRKGEIQRREREERHGEEVKRDLCRETEEGGGREIWRGREQLEIGERERVVKREGREEKDGGREERGKRGERREKKGTREEEREKRR